MPDHARDDAVDALRRRLLQAGAGAATLGALPAIPSAAAQGSSSFDWKQFKGEKIEVSFTKSPRGELLTKYQKEFEDLTGITVGSEMTPEQQQRQKAVIEFNSGKTSFDVIHLSYHVQKSQFAAASGWSICGRTSAIRSWHRPISTSPISARAGWRTRRRATGGSTPCRSISISGSFTGTRTCSRRRASRTRRITTRSWTPPRRSTTRRRASSATSGAASRTRMCRYGQISSSATAANTSTPTASC